MTLTYVSYEKMGESLAELEIDEAGLRVLRKTDWVVTEKIHGASFALVAELTPAGRKIELGAAKRRSLLASGEDFFGHEALLARIGPAARDLMERVRAAHPRAERAAVHGELFGGSYPHPAVRSIPGVEPVQTGIHYSPRVELCAFDLAITEPDGGRRYLDQDEALALARAAGLFCAEPLFVGSYEDAMAFPIGFDSTIPARLGLPPLAEPNPAEGVVVKPRKSLVVSTRRGPARPVVKRKIPQFAEDRRFHGSTKREPPKGAEAPLARLEWEMLSLVTENRLAATASKIGRVRSVDDAAAREVLAAFEEEVWSTLAISAPALLAALPAQDVALLRSVLADEARRLLEASVASPKVSRSTG